MTQIHLLQNDGQCLDWADLPTLTDAESPYRLYRFLTEVEDILRVTDDATIQLREIMPRVQRLLEQSPWLFFNPLTPDPHTGWAVQMLYDEPEFPLTVQLVAWAPGTESPIHNHGAWGIVAMLQGEEEHTFWHRTPTPEHPDRITQVGQQRLSTGDMIGILPEAIHQVKAVSQSPTVSFNLYGETDYSARYEFNLTDHLAKIF